MHIISLGEIPPGFLEDEEDVRAWVTSQQCHIDPTHTFSAVCLRVAHTGDPDNPQHNPPRDVTVADVLCDWPDIEGLPVTYHDLASPDSILH